MFRKKKVFSEGKKDDLFLHGNYISDDELLPTRDQFLPTVMMNLGQQMSILVLRKAFS